MQQFITPSCTMMTTVMVAGSAVPFFNKSVTQQSGKACLCVCIAWIAHLQHCCKDFRKDVYLSGCILDGSGLKHVQAFQARLGNGLQLLPAVWLEYHPPVPIHQNCIKNRTKRTSTLLDMLRQLEMQMLLHRSRQWAAAESMQLQIHVSKNALDVAQTAGNTL